MYIYINNRVINFMQFNVKLNMQKVCGIKKQFLFIKMVIKTVNISQCCDVLFVGSQLEMGYNNSGNAEFLELAFCTSSCWERVIQVHNIRSRSDMFRKSQVFYALILQMKINVIQIISRMYKLCLISKRTKTILKGLHGTF